jgi:hypothetical protein
MEYEFMYSICMSVKIKLTEVIWEWSYVVWFWMEIDIAAHPHSGPHEGNLFSDTEITVECSI